MQWTWFNIFFIVVGVLAIIGCSLLIRFRGAAQARVARENTTGVYGERLGSRIAERRQSVGVVPGAIIGIVLGVGCIVAGLLVHG